MSILISSLDALEAARPAYKTAEYYYKGQATERFSSIALQKILGSESSQFNFNYSCLVIQSRLSRMEIASVTTQDGSADDTLANIWADNALDQELQDAFEGALVYGDSYLMTWPREDGSGVDVFYNSPLDVRVFYDTENPRKKSHAIKRWVTDEGKLRVNLYFADTIEKYISKGKIQTSYVDGDFEEYFDQGQESWPLPNETGAVPVFHLRTSRQYGTPEHKQSYGPQDAITKLIATQVSSIDYTAFPQRYVLEDPTSNDGINPQAEFGGVMDEDDTENASLNLKSGPGGIWALKGVKTVGQFDPASPDVFVTPFKTFIEALGTVTNTPTHAFNVGALPSGESLRAAEAPLNKRVDAIERLFGGVIREMHEYALSTLGLDSKVIVTWAPIATYDDADLWATVKAKTDAGIPMREALMEAGYTNQQVMTWYPESDVEPRSPAQLDAIATAIQKLSAAVTLQIISADEARAMLPQDILSGAYIPVDLDKVIPSE